MVKVDLGVLPGGVGRHVALRLVVDLGDQEGEAAGVVEAGVVPPSEHVHAHDAEDQPEDQTHQQDVEDGGDGPEEGVHHHLHTHTHTHTHTHDDGLD